MWVADVSVIRLNALNDGLSDRMWATKVSSVLIQALDADGTPTPAKRAPSGAAHAADILALARATLDGVARALRTAPEVRSNRLMSRAPVDIEDVLMELQPMQAETSITELAGRLGVSPAQLRSTALRLQRLGVVKVSPEGVSLTGVGRQKLARLEMARAAVLRRLAVDLHELPPEHARLVLGFLSDLLERTEDVVEAHIGGAPRS